MTQIDERPSRKIIADNDLPRVAAKTLSVEDVLGFKPFSSDLSQRYLWAEMVFLFVVVPFVLCFSHLSYWAICSCFLFIFLFSVYHLKQTYDVSWRRLWEGRGWLTFNKKFALFRFLLFAPLMAEFVWLFARYRFFELPYQKPMVWLLVMVFYPLLSVIPQEVVFRSFFFRRYGDLVSNKLHIIILNSISFGLAHVLFHNWIAPFFSLVGGIFFSYSYVQHRSLKWAVVEHALYGCFLFTIGLGWYFVYVPEI